jgi:hypothetical protein
MPAEVDVMLRIVEMFGPVSRRLLPLVAIGLALANGHKWS